LKKKPSKRHKSDESRERKSVFFEASKQTSVGSEFLFGRFCETRKQALEFPLSPVPRTSASIECVDRLFGFSASNAGLSAQQQCAAASLLALVAV
jgi:hypothetical protein